MSKFERAKKALAHEVKQRNFAEQSGYDLGVIRAILNIFDFKKRIKQEEFNSSKTKNQ